MGRANESLTLCANLSSMTRIAPLALATLFAATAVSAQTASFTDPANLRGERVSPRTGRELPIDGGLGNNTLGLEQMMRRLNTRASLMLIVAHPDDEDGGMLTYYSRGLGARVAMLTLNRGEGGQNAVTGDFEDALGLLRTQELLSADRYSGVQQMFGTEVDFGFSKTKAEAFKKWGHERVLYDAVRAVRLFRPLVIAAVFSGSVTDGHGQHQVSGEIAQEVFKAAGDPNVFPELTREGILPWQPLKVYARVPMQAISGKGLFDYATGQYVPAEFTNYVTGEKSTTPPTPDVIVHEGETDPLLTYAAARPEDLRAKPAEPDAKLSYVQFARIGLGLQRSQIGSGMRVPSPGKYDVAYHRFASKLPDQPLHETSFFDAIDVTLNGMVRLAPAMPNELREPIVNLGLAIAEASSSFAQDHDASSAAPKLSRALQATDKLIDAGEHADLPAEQRSDLLHELRVKRVQLNDALALALALRLDATAQGKDHIAGAPISVHLELASDHAPLTLTAAHIDDARGDTVPADALPAFAKAFNSSHTAQTSLEVDGRLTASVTRPYFLRDNIELPVYTLLDPALRNAPATPPALAAWATAQYQGTAVEVGRIVHDGPQPVAIVPAATIGLTPHAQVLPTNDGDAVLSTWIQPAGHPSYTPKLVAPRGWKPDLTGTDATSGEMRFHLKPPAGARTPATVRASVVTPDHGTYSEGIHAIGYGDLPRTNAFVPAVDRVVPADLELPPANKRRIGYLPGTGDAVPDALASIGLPVTPLTVADLTPEHLKQFDTVILGVRTYAAHPDLHGAPTQALFDFARNGGNVVVQYQTIEFHPDDAPFPADLGSNEKVVDETTPVHLLTSANPLLSIPNKLTDADFNGWNEERGHGFLSTWDSHYTALTETHDPGEPSEHIAPQDPQRGGLISTPLGKGRWTYVAFALYRQLPEAVPGAFRLFVNLITPPLR